MDDFELTSEERERLLKLIQTEPGHVKAVALGLRGVALDKYLLTLKRRKEGQLQTFDPHSSSLQPLKVQPG